MSTRLSDEELDSIEYFLNNPNDTDAFTEGEIRSMFTELKESRAAREKVREALETIARLGRTLQTYDQQTAREALADEHVRKYLEG